MVRSIDFCQLDADRVVRIILALGYAAIKFGAKHAAGMSVTAWNNHMVSNIDPLMNWSFTL
jgi:hypothetical protein